MARPEGSRTLVVIPTYEERGTLGDLVESLLALHVEGADRADHGLEILIVDDASPDGTGQLADALVARHPGRVHVRHRAGKEGLGPAYRDGLGWGLSRGYQRFVAMDADLSHDPRQLPRLLAATATADVVIGSRYVPGGDVHRWTAPRVRLSTWGNRYVRALTGLPVRDATSGFRVFRRPVLEAIDVAALRSDGYAFQVETALRAWWAGFEVVEVPITFVERREGASKLSRRVVLEAAWRVPSWGLGGRAPRGPHPDSVRTRR